MNSSFRFTLICLFWNLCSGQRNFYVPPDLPQDVMVDVINNFGVELLKKHNEYNENNLALSPYGALSVFVALKEGTRGTAQKEIEQALRLPPDASVVRIGLRDVLRRLKTYFIPEEGFLAGLTFNNDNISLKSDYKNLLMFYGYDVDSFNTPLVHTASRSNGDVTTVVIPQEPSSTTAMETPPATTVSEVEVFNSITTTGAVTTNVEETTTESNTEETSPEKVEDATTTSAISSTAASAVFRNIQTTATSTVESVEEITSTLAATSETPTASTTTIAPQTVATASTTVSSQPVATTSTMESTTVSSQPVATTSTMESTTVSSQPAETTSTMESTTVSSQPAETASTMESTNVSSQPVATTSTMESTTVSSQPAETASTMESTTVTTESIEIESTTVSATVSPETVTTTEPTTVSSQSVDTASTIESTTVSSQSVDTTASTIESTTISLESETTIVAETTSTTTEESAASKRKRYSDYEYKPSKFYYPSENLRPNFQFFKNDFDNSDSSAVSFLIDGKTRESNVSFMTYKAILPYCYIKSLKSLALSLPLESESYYLLIILPLDDCGADYVLERIGFEVTLGDIVSSLVFTHVKATIPSFILEGTVQLTSTVKKLGIHAVFEPQLADFSEMTEAKDIYVTNAEQMITVKIKNYVDPNNKLDYFGSHYQQNPVWFKADHPFLYFVMDSNLHVSLMAGKVMNPLSSKIS